MNRVQTFDDFDPPTREVGWRRIIRPPSRPGAPILDIKTPTLLAKLATFALAGVLTAVVIEIARAFLH